MTIALIDASLVYAASRWLHAVHDDPRFDYREQFRATEDESLFYEFLHNLVLYDEILLDNSSVERIGSEIEGLIRHINELDPVVRLGDFATVHEADLYGVMRAAVRLLSGAVRGGYPISRLAAIAVPWSYRSAEHDDRPDMERLAAAEGLDPALVPLALFQYRGLCYAGYAAKHARVEHVPVAYVAAPGRMEALMPVLSERDAKTYAFPRGSYAELARKLALPPTRYDFDFMDSSDADLTAFTLELQRLEPKRALLEALELRRDFTSARVRAEWGERLFDYRTTAAACGPVYTQVIEGSEIHGDVHQQIIVARSSDW